MLKRFAAALAVLATAAFVFPALAEAPPAATPAKSATALATPTKAPAPAKAAIAVFAGGCFWCVESDFDKVPGVTSTISGYTGGRVKNPSYEDVTSETSGHREAVKITYDPAKVSYAQLVDYFFHHIDPTDSGGQFCDRGESYTTAIFVASPQQRAVAEKAKTAAAATLKKPIATSILDLTVFYPAEDYHQNYYKTNPGHYAFYRSACGRDARVRQVWGKAAGAH